MRQGNARRGSALGASALLVLLGGCAEHPLTPGLEVLQRTQFAPSLGVDLEAMTRGRFGVYVLDLVEGTGSEVRPGCAHYELVINYEAYLADGRLVGAEPAFRFFTGYAAVIPGLEVGVEGMRAGGARRLVLPPGQGFGQRPPAGSPIHPGAVLVFELVLDLVIPRCG